MNSVAPLNVQHCTTSCVRQTVVAAVLRELARTPLLGRFLLSREPQVLGAVFSILALPETLLACICSRAGLPTTLNASLTCRFAHAHLWESPAFWRSLLQALGVSDASLEAVQLQQFSAKPTRRTPPTAKAFQDFARRWFFGIDVLVGMPVRLENDAANSSLLHKWRQNGHGGKLDLEDARKAVTAMQPEDGEVIIQSVADSLSNLLRNRACGEQELLKAEELLEAVSTRCELFDTAQMLNMLGAHQKADEERLPLAPFPKLQHAALNATAIMGRPSRRARRTAAATTTATATHASPQSPFAGHSASAAA